MLQYLSLQLDVDALRLHFSSVARSGSSLVGSSGADQAARSNFVLRFARLIKPIVLVGFLVVFFSLSEVSSGMVEERKSTHYLKPEIS